MDTRKENTEFILWEIFELPKLEYLFTFSYAPAINISRILVKSNLTNHVWFSYRRKRWAYNLT